MYAVDAELRRSTGQDSRYWLNRVGALIGEASRPISGEASPHLQTTDPAVWIARLSEEVWKASLPRITQAGLDPNMAAAASLSLILGLFYARIVRAKAHDRRRPIDQRRYAMLRFTEYAQLLTVMMTSNERDHEYFPSQGWDDPWLPTATYEPDEAELARSDYARRVSQAPPKEVPPKKAPPPSKSKSLPPKPASRPSKKRKRK